MGMPESYPLGTGEVQLSLCNLRDVVNRTLVDKAGKTFSVCDEFLVHAFKAHFIAAICSHFKITAPTDDITHESSLQWLQAKAEKIVTDHVMPTESKDTVYGIHRSLLYKGFLYQDLRNAIRYEEGEHIIRLWKHWAILFLETKRKNYSNEAFNLICNIKASFPKHIAYIATHNQTINTSGKPGRGKPLDQMLEHYNL